MESRLSMEAVSELNGWVLTGFSLQPNMRCTFHLADFFLSSSHPLTRAAWLTFYFPTLVEVKDLKYNDILKHIEHSSKEGMTCRYSLRWSGGHTSIIEAREVAVTYR
jgi:hypothetical protein